MISWICFENKQVYYIILANQNEARDLRLSMSMTKPSRGAHKRIYVQGYLP